MSTSKEGNLEAPTRHPIDWKNPDYFNEELLNQELERDIVAWSNKDKGVVRTNVQGWHSTTDMHEKPEYKKLVDMLYACQKTIYGYCKSLSLSCPRLKIPFFRYSFYSSN